MASANDPPAALRSGADRPTLDEAVAAAARCLGSASFPLVAGLGTDVDGLRAALGLAEALRGAIDHAGGDVMVDEMRVLADAGQMTTTPAEARHRADLVVVAGPAALAGAEALGLFDDAHPLYGWRAARTVILIGCGDVVPNTLGTATRDVVALGGDPARMGAVLAALRALVGGRAVGSFGPGLPPGPEVARVAAMLKAAGFGVLVYDPASLGALGIEQAQGLVKDLNAGTRFSSLAVPGALGGRIATVVSAWTTGFPLRLGFGRGYPDYDPWRFAAERLIASGEADALLWVAPLGPALPAWAPRSATVALVAPGASADAEVVIEVGVPGIDHGGTLYGPLRDGFAYEPASAPSDRPSAADVIGRIAAAIGRAAA